MGTRVLLAGGEDKRLMRTLIKCKTRFVLFSYFYIKDKWGKKGLQEFKECLKNFEFVLIDSGAFTLFTHGHNMTYAEIEAYAYGYAEFLEEVKGLVDAAVELDLYEISVVGDKAHRLREDILEKSGVPICPVFHGDVRPILYKNTKKRKYVTTNDSDWHFFTKKYKYTGLASQLIYHAGTSNIARLVNIALQNDSVVHGFGITRQNFIRSSRFYTMDSTAWTNGMRFGTTYIYQHNKLLIVDYHYKKQWRRRYIPIWQREGLDLDVARLMADKSSEVDLVNCWGWTQFQNYVYNFTNRDYWDKNLLLNTNKDQGKSLELPGVRRNLCLK